MKKLPGFWFNCLSGSALVVFALAVSSAAYAQPAESVTALIQHQKSVFSGNRTYWIGRPIARIAKVVTPDTSCMGFFDAATFDNVTDGASVRGWAWSKRDKKGISQILLADGSGIVVGLASGGVARPDVVATLPEIKDRATGWQGYSKYAKAVSAYGLIDGGREACQLQSTLDIAPPGQR